MCCRFHLQNAKSYANLLNNQIKIYPNLIYRIIAFKQYLWMKFIGKQINIRIKK